MKFIVCQLVFCCLSFGVFAQQHIGIDTALKFDRRPSRCEKKWVVVAKRDTAKQYVYGYIYIDLTAGFTFDLKGRFRVDANNKYIPDTSATQKSSVKYRIAPNWNKVAVLPFSHFKELNISAEPAWLKFYYDKLDTASAYYNYRMGFNYNAIGDCEPALAYLKKANSITPHPAGVQFELIYAYNGLMLYSEAIKILVPAIQLKPSDPLLYKELAYAYTHNKDYDEAIVTYKKGLLYFPDNPSDEKCEMAYNLASIYRAQHKEEEYKSWMTKAKSYAIPDSLLYKQILAAGF